MSKNVIFLHGFCETKEMWDDFETKLSKDFNVYCLDLPGFGDFHFDVTGLEISEIAQLVYNQILELNLNDFVLIGHSLGGYVALEILKQFPSKITALCLFHSTVFADSEERKMKRNDVISFIEKHGSAKFVRSFIPQLFISEKREECKESIKKLVEKGSIIEKRTLIQITKAMQNRFDNSEIIQKINIPVLFIVGKKDKSVSIEDSLKQIHFPKNSTVKILESCGHMGMFEDCSNTFKSIKHFLS